MWLCIVIVVVVLVLVLVLVLLFVVIVVVVAVVCRWACVAHLTSQKKASFCVLCIRICQTQGQLGRQDSS